MGARPKTLLASFIPPLCTYLIFIRSKDSSDILLLISILLSALFIQISTNFFNDAIDFEKGSDEKRVGPSRITSSGFVTVTKVKRWAIISLGLATLFGVPILLKGGLIYFFMGTLSLFLTYGYTGGPFALAYKGLGEVFVFIFFGLFSVLGTYHLYRVTFDWNVFYIAISFGLLATTLICINNYRDRHTDPLTKKMTLATLVSDRTYLGIIVATVLAPYFIYTFLPFRSYVILFSLPLALKIISHIFKSDGEKLNPVLAMAGGHLLLFSISCVLSINL